MEEIKERILGTAQQLFLKFGIRNVTMDEIASELGISKKTIYQHFEDKDAVVHSIAENMMGHEVCESQRIMQESKDPIEAVFKQTELFKNNPAISNPTLLYDLKKYHPRTWNLFLNHKQSTFLEVVKNNLREGVKQGFYRKEINIDILALLRMETMEFSFNIDVFPPTQFNPVQLQTTFIDHFLRGIFTEKGLKLYESYQNNNIQNN